jgi:hypothetical protein
MAIEFSEGCSAWQAIPAWAGFLLQLGHKWPAKAPGERRIALVSMPCDSPGAGLITLGATIRDLADPKANNLDRHYDSLLQFAKQFLGSCSTCTLNSCDPETKHCGYVREATGNVRSSSNPRGTYKISNSTNFEQRQIAFERNGVTVRPKPQYAVEWYIDNEAPPQWNEPTGELPLSLYPQIIERAPLLPENARKSYSGLCLAGRTTGEAASRSACSSIRFRNRASGAGLEELLTIHGWSPCSISRVAFFNALTESLDCSHATPALVIADGDNSFLKVMGRSQFAQSDIVGVVQRTIERDRLEALGIRMAQQNQWYFPDSQLLDQLGPVPLGVSLSVLRRAE